MGYPMLLLFLALASSSSSSIEAADDDQIKSARLLDLFIRDYTFKSNPTIFKTGKLHSVSLPANLSGIGVNTARFRCGSLRRYGARLEEFNLGPGVIIYPCIERIVLVRQNLGENWSSIYYDNYELLGYKLVSPVLGLLAYNAGEDAMHNNNPFEVEIQAKKTPIAVDFTNVCNYNDTNGRRIPLCATFQKDGKVKLTEQVKANVCLAEGPGHFGLVVESPLIPAKIRKEKGWKVAVGSSIGAALGAFLLGLLLVALFVKEKKKKARMDEMERRAYEEEALQVTMVGHVRAPTASSCRTAPIIERQYRPPRRY
ncbi:uncharacterized protein LOC124945462 [Impatiens glandulifera]|uniref:uncharacterized protein LOC124945462 n=1 Tax=Impatiens glandulifera TaxID=253017 RepID=UPI001FB05502|nr:uncharacterized protein LOC124945462 [Impatiens glandulifera]